MHRRGQFRYAENDQLQMLALPYIGQHLQMVVLLPRSRDGIGPLESSLTPASLAEWTSGMREQEVNVALTKFKMSSGFSLAQTLKAMGLNDAFDPSRADFSGFGDVPEAERRKVRDQLERYCGQDTEGMIWIVEALRRLVG